MRKVFCAFWRRFYAGLLGVVFLGIVVFLSPEPLLDWTTGAGVSTPVETLTPGESHRPGRERQDQSEAGRDLDDPIPPRRGGFFTPAPDADRIQSAAVGGIDTVPDMNHQDERNVIRTHQVQPGETVWEIARENNLEVATIVAANDLADPNSILVGQELKIPPVDGILYKVKPGETLWEISHRFGISLVEVINQNHIHNPGRIRVGQLLLLPGARAREAVAQIATSQGVNSAQSGYSWPLAGGRITSRFGPRWGRMHTGVDIAAPVGTTIRAAQSGRVRSAGWMGGYGWAVILKHPDGSATLYAHASRLLVSPGQRVEKGQPIARVGSSGNSTGPHLHFEIIIGNKARDPLKYLPR